MQIGSSAYNQNCARCHGLEVISGGIAPDLRLLPLGKQLRGENPYRGNGEAIRVGSSAYNQNCARCHGLEAVSGGIAPDLRKLDVDAETDQYFLESVQRGKVRNGAVYMPPYQEILNQEAIWAIKAYLETRREK